MLQPVLRLSAELADQLMHEIKRTATAGDHCEFRIEALEVQLTHDALMTLLDEEPSRPRFELLLDETELALGEPKARAVVALRRIRVGEEDLGRGLFDQSAADGATQDIARTLRREGHDAVQLAPGLRSIFREALERGIHQQTPELIHPAHEAPPVEELPHEVKEIERDRRTRDLVIKEVRDIKANERMASEARDNHVRLVVEYPGIVPLGRAAPGQEAGVEAFRIGR